MKIRITESQLKKAKLITEGQERVNTFLEKAEDIKDKVNRLYGKITFSTLAELLEGETGLDIILNDLVQWRTIIDTHYVRATDFFDRMPEDEYYEKKFDGLHKKVDDINQQVGYDKIDMLEGLVENLKELADSNIEENFKDTKKIDI